MYGDLFPSNKIKRCNNLIQQYNNFTYKEFNGKTVIISISISIGRTAFLKALPDAKDISEKRNEAGDSVFHVIAKFRPPPEERTFIKIVKPFIEKGYRYIA
jgi:hypothetical protein